MADLSYAEKSDNSTRIIRAIRDMLTSEIRNRYLRMLSATTEKSLYGKIIKEGLSAKPLSSIDFGIGIFHAHAVDLFIKEGASVYAFEGGVVVLAERNWNTDDPFSTSSIKCGNSVIIYNSQTSQFSRYCHLETVLVSPGDIVFSGTTIGSVGHTGVTASLSGHGNHLHFEINYYDTLWQKMIPRTHQQLKELITAIP